MIERVEIESEEDGFHLILHGEIEVEPSQVEDDEGVFGLRSPANLRLSQDAALQLREQVHGTIDPWWAEAEGVRADFERYQRTGERPDYLPNPEGGLSLPCEEALREAGDLERKRRREQA